MDNIDLACAETVKDKSTENNAGFITYSRKIYFTGTWLDNSGYLITQSKTFAEKRIPYGSKHWGEQKESSILEKLVLKMKY